jgi:2-dehydro-3-deoxyphosphogalactonate aldolase
MSVGLRSCLTPLPLIAVLRGIAPEQVSAICGALCDEGFRILEVPLNSPRPLESIRICARDFGERCLVGAGTVVDVADVQRVRDAGGRLVVMPHADIAVVEEAKGLGMICVPGVATVTEAFGALAAGADGLKMFPAEALPPAALRAWRAVLPRDTLVFPVGGIRPETMAAYWAVGASGFGTGSNLYAPGSDPEGVRRSAAAYAAAYRALPPRSTQE